MQAAQIAAATYVDVKHDPAWRFDIIQRLAPQAKRVLDMAAGYGTAVFHGRMRGYDVYGLEPSAEKVAIAKEVLQDNQLPMAWHDKLVRALGENLPFSDGCFDGVTSYQTLEHVRDLAGVLRECIRITRSGGFIHIRCPDYSGTFEGHYQLPWLPMPHGWSARYLRLLGRPETGWQGIRPVTRRNIFRTLKALEADQPGLRLSPICLRFDQFKLRLAQKMPGLTSPWVLQSSYGFYRLLHFFKSVFRTEKTIHLWISVQRPPL